MGKDNVTLTVIKRELLRDKIALVSVVFLLVLAVVLVVSVFTIDEYAIFEIRVRDRMLRANLPPSSYFRLGTDGSGQDVLTLLIIATRNSLTITIFATLISSVLGVIYGMISGYTGGAVDNIMNGVVDAITSIPILISLIILVNFFGGFTPWNFILTISLLAWTSVAKVVRARVLQEKNLEYVMASKTLGTTNLTIIFKKLIPNISTVIIGSLLLNAAAIIIMETSLAFFLVNAPPRSNLPVNFVGSGPTLGTILSLTGYPNILRFRWWQWVPATMMITLIMYSINSIGNALNRAADTSRR